MILYYLSVAFGRYNVPKLLLTPHDPWSTSYDHSVEGRKARLPPHLALSDIWLSSSQ